MTATPPSRSRVSFASLSGLRCGRMMMPITSSTIESTPGGTVRPRFAAVFRLHLDPGLPKFEQMPPM